MCVCVCVSGVRLCVCQYTHWQIVKWFFHQFISESTRENIRHLLDESRSGLAVVLNGQDDWILASHKGKLVNGLNTLLQYEREVSRLERGRQRMCRVWVSFI